MSNETKGPAGVLEDAESAPESGAAPEKRRGRLHIGPGQVKKEIGMPSSRVQYIKRIFGNISLDRSSRRTMRLPSAS